MVRVQEEDFSLDEEIANLTRGDPSIGAIASFVGLVRDQNANGPISAMELEHYPGMTERQLQEIEEEAIKRWDLQASLIIHRHGRLLPGQRIVLVITASRHRQAALESCAFLIDWLKTKAPFWKKEEGSKGINWVEARTEDDQALDKWNNP